MRRQLVTAVAVGVSLVCAAPAAATQVTVLGPGRHVVRRDDPHLPAVDLPAVGSHSSGALERRAAPRPKPPPATVLALARLILSGAIPVAEAQADLAIYQQATAATAALAGVRKAELQSVIANADEIAASGQLTPDRLAAVFLTIDRNRQWWTTGPVPAAGDRVGFSGSQLVWEYYPGQGIELQMLANFAKANSLLGAGANTDLRALLGELIPLASNRGGATTWEYYFTFEGGAPPWTSAISQGTALQALARASKRLHEPALAALGHGALASFELPPPVGLRVPTRAGAEYLIYSFAPRTFVLNAFVQSLIGLYDFSSITGDPTAAALYNTGEAEARVALPLYDTGAWSLYSLTEEATLAYHQLVIGFLNGLCSRSGQPIYCDYADRFTAYLHTSPAVAATTTRVRAGRPAELGFVVDKISDIELTVTRGARRVYSNGEQAGHGAHLFSWPRPAKPGSYTLTLVATDLAGNRAEATAPLAVLPPKNKRHRGS